jgi:hypothetical protein
MLETGCSEHPQDIAQRVQKAISSREPVQFVPQLTSLSTKAKRAMGNDLQIWMMETKRTDVSLAVEITGRLSAPMYSTLRSRQIGARTIARWRKGLLIPRHPQHFAVLTEISNGRVTANSFVSPNADESTAGGSGPVLA